MLKKIFKYFAISASGLLLLMLLVFFTPALWRHFVTYPKLEKEVKEFCELRRETTTITKLNTYRGVLHVHSYWSHDSEGTLFDLIPAAKYAGIDFIFLTDDPRGNIDTIPRGYKDIMKTRT
jgi:hypothetical protein